MKIDLPLLRALLYVLSRREIKSRYMIVEYLKKISKNMREIVIIVMLAIQCLTCVILWYRNPLIKIDQCIVAKFFISDLIFVAQK